MCDEKKEQSNSNFSPLSFIFGLLGVVAILWTYFFVSRNKDRVFSLENCVDNSDAFELNNINKKNEKKNEENKKDGNLNDRQKKVLSILKKDKEVTVDGLLKKISGVSERTFRRDMNKFEDLGYIKKTGSTKAAKYILNK